MSAVFQKNHQDNMGFTDVLSKLFGNKAQRDLKEITPYIDKIKAVYPEIQKLTNDQLRERTEQLKTRIAEYVATENHAMHMFLPRASALAEVQWCDPAVKDYAGFLKRIPKMLAIYGLHGWTYAPYVWEEIRKRNF